MLAQLSVFLFANLVHSSYGIPLELERHYSVKQFLSTRIIGGVEAPPGYGKHMAALLFGEVSAFFICGGSIVAKRHILTAAHCIEPMVVWGQEQLISSFHAVVGSPKWTSAKKNIRFTGYYNHPEYNSRTIKNDIGVLLLAEDIKPSYDVTIIPLDFRWVIGGTNAYVNGWGRVRTMPDTLQLLYVNVMSGQQCEEAVREVSTSWPSPPPVDPAIEICTFHSFGHGMCHGDSGSALVRNDTQTQIGIVSWGFPCAVGAPDMFVRISAFFDFLRPILGRHYFTK